MVVCRFFLNGNCRYGDNCWNEHPSGGNQGFSITAQRQLFGGNRGGGGQKVSFRDSSTQNGNSYRWVSPDAQQHQQGSRTATTTQQISAADIVKGLAIEVVTTWEGGKMWPFSCLGFEKDLPSLPGFMDISTEEMRFDAYEALKAGNIQPYVQKVEAAFNQLTAQRQELKNPNLTLRQKLVSFIDDCRRKKTSGSTSHVSLFSDCSTVGNVFGGVNGGDLFGSNPTGTQASSGLFGQPSTVGQTGNQTLFGQPETQPGFGQNGSQSLFGQTGTQPSSFGQTGPQSLFGHGAFSQDAQSSSLFGQTTFGQPQTGQASIFGQSTTLPGAFGQDQTQPTTGLFGKPAVSSTFASFSTPQASNVTPGISFQSSSTFGQSSAPVANLFGHSVSVVPPDSGIGASAPQENKPVQESQSGQTTSMYTPLDKLRTEEVEQFRAPVFSLGFIPTRPPPRELCF